MKHGWKRALAAVLAALMLVSLLPLTEQGRALAVGNYGKTTDKGVAVRKTTSTSGEVWFRVDEGTVASILDVITVGKATWYQVILEQPGSATGNTYIGYIHGDYFVRLTESEALAWEANPVNKTDKYGVRSSGATGRIRNSGVNLRAEASLKASVLLRLDRGTIVDLLSIPAANDPDPWYQVTYGGQTGYIQGPFLEILDSGTLTPSTPAPSSATPTPTPTAAAGTQTQTPATAAPASPTGSGSGSYVRLLLNSTPLYLTPNGQTVGTWTGVGTTLPLVGTATMAGGASWYPVIYQGNTCYVRGDAVQQTSAEGETPSGSASSPTAAASGTAATTGYVKTIKGGVNLRLKPSGNVITQLQRNVVVPCLASPTHEDGYDWYYVQFDNLKGYLRGDCVTPCTQDGTPLSGSVTVAPSVTAAPTAAAAASYVRTTATGVNLRTVPAGASLEQIGINVVLPVTGKPVTAGNFTWYPVRAASGRTGYLRSDCVVVTNASGETATPAPASASTPAPTPSAGVVYGYVQVTKNSVNVRKEAAGDTFRQVQKGSVWPLVGVEVTESNYTWFPVNVNGTVGYIRNDCAVQLTDEQVQAYLAGQGIPVVTVTPTPAPTATPAPVKVVQTVLTGVFLRKAASKDAQAVDQVSIGTVMTYTATKTVGGSTWYGVVYKGQQLWVLGSCVKTLTAAEYEAWTASNPTRTAEPAVTATAAPTGYVKTTKGGVNVRSTAGGKAVLGQLSRNKVLAYTSKTHKGNFDWYRVTTSYGVGWVRGDCVTETQANGSALPTPTPAPAATASSGSSVITSSQQEASYSILKLGSTGSAVTRLTQELKNQGYYTGNVTSAYTAEVEAAVKAFQSAKGLTVDGIAGSATQHKLFNTVPVGTADGRDMSFVCYPAEKIDWFTGGIQELWPRGMNVKVYDVKTGIVWWAHRWAGAYHADIEPLTAADTARLCAIYGVSSPNEIVKKNLYERRPSLVTIGNRTFACALYGVPHNYGAGDISNNNWPGQICMHFTNSKTHGTKIVYYLNTNAIQYAWENAPNGHK